MNEEEDYQENDFSTEELTGEFKWDDTSEHNYNYFNNYN